MRGKKTYLFFFFQITDGHGAHRFARLQADQVAHASLCGSSNVRNLVHLSQ